MASSSYFTPSQKGIGIGKQNSVDTSLANQVLNEALTASRIKAAAIDVNSLSARQRGMRRASTAPESILDIAADPDGAESSTCLPPLLESSDDEFVSLVAQVLQGLGLQIVQAYMDRVQKFGEELETLRAAQIQEGEELRSAVHVLKANLVRLQQQNIDLRKMTRKALVEYSSSSPIDFSSSTGTSDVVVVEPTPSLLQRHRSASILAASRRATSADAAEPQDDARPCLSTSPCHINDIGILEKAEARVAASQMARGGRTIPVADAGAAAELGGALLPHGPFSCSLKAKRHDTGSTMDTSEETKLDGDARSPQGSLRSSLARGAPPSVPWLEGQQIDAACKLVDHLKSSLCAADVAMRELENWTLHIKDTTKIGPEYFQRGVKGLVEDLPCSRVLGIAPLQGVMSMPDRYSLLSALAETESRHLSSVASSGLDIMHMPDRSSLLSALAETERRKQAEICWKRRDAVMVAQQNSLQRSHHALLAAFSLAPDPVGHGRVSAIEPSFIRYSCSSDGDPIEAISHTIKEMRKSFRRNSTADCSDTS